MLEIDGITTADGINESTEGEGLNLDRINVIIMIREMETVERVS
jgi:hypothetical protein